MRARILVAAGVCRRASWPRASPCNRLLRGISSYPSPATSAHQLANTICTIVDNIMAVDDHLAGEEIHVREVAHDISMSG